MLEGTLNELNIALCGQCEISPDGMCISMKGTRVTLNRDADAKYFISKRNPKSHSGYETIYGRLYELKVKYIEMQRDKAFLYLCKKELELKKKMDKASEEYMFAQETYDDFMSSKILYLENFIKSI